MPPLLPRWIASIALFMGGGGLSSAAEYLQAVKPVLKDRCYACHGALKQKSGLRVDTAAAMAEADILQSGILLERITATDLEDRMPPEGEPLKPEEVDAIRAWINAGAPIPEDERGEADPRDHWAFQPIVRPSVPLSGSPHPIDAFLDRAQQKRGVRLTPRADALLLKRRVALDLTGLAPTGDELETEESYETLVDRLLASPHYGERWGRHWMDVWRYSDEYGLGAQLRFSQKHLWHWRDWILESLNIDKGYDRMILEMLAGDEIAPTDPKVYRATGYLARNYYLFNRTTWLDNTIESVSKAFLGLTMNCAKCHDHKYDPIEQKDYYRFRAFFEPHQIRLDPVPGITNFDQGGIPRAYDSALDLPTYLHRRGDPRDQDTGEALAPNSPGFFQTAVEVIEPRTLPVYAWAPGTRRYFQEAVTDRLKNALRDSEDAGPEKRLVLQAELAAAEARATADRAAFVGDGDTEATARAAEIATRELAVAQAALRIAELEASEPRDEAALNQARNAHEEKTLTLDQPLTGAYAALRGSRKALETPEHKEADYPATYPPSTTGRRTALARWIIHPENPLTARVAANHIWTRHFGTPLVESVSDLGRRAPRPELAELLDYLATELIDSGWRMKSLHRLILTSAAYQRDASALGHASSMERDPGNATYWRGPTRRMESQLLRDNLLHLSGQLDPTIGGPSLPTDQPSRRRSLYFRHSRDDTHAVLTLFDEADIFSCYRRSESVTPQQALALSNSALAIEAADGIAQQFASLDRETFTRRLWKTLLCREITSDELSACLDAIAQWMEIAERDGDETPEDRARARLAHTLINHNDFLSIR